MSGGRLALDRLATLRTPGRDRAWRRYGAAGGLFILAFAAFFHAILLHPGSRIIFGFGDGSHVLRDYWAAAAQHRNPLNFTHDALNGAPQGLPRTPATLLASGGIQTAFVWWLRGPLGLVGAWNLYLFLGLVGTALAMFALLDRLGCTFLAALFGGYVFAFSPYALERAYAGHADLLQNWVFVVVLVALLRARERRTAGSAALVGGSLGIAFYLSSYQGLFAAFMVVVFLGLELVRAGDARERLRVLALGAGAFSVNALTLVPILVLYAREHSTVQATTSHDPADFVTYAGTLSAYLPSPRNPLFHWLGGFHPSDLTEQTLYPSLAALVLGVGGAVLLFRRNAWLLESDRRRRSALFAAALAPAAFITSFGTHLHLGGLAIPLPMSLVTSVTSYWRVSSRFGMLVGFALAVSAALALSALARGDGRRRLALPLLALTVAIVELLPGNISAVDTSPPPWVLWLSHEPRGIVASYPVLGGLSPPREVLEPDYWYQQFDRDPIFELAAVSASQLTTRDEAIRIVARDLSHPLSARVLATEGVRYVVLHLDAYRHAQLRPTLPDPAVFVLLRRFGEVSIYGVRARPVELDRVLAANVGRITALMGLPVPSVRLASGFNAPEPFEGSTGRWLIQSGRFELSKHPTMAVTITGTAFSNGVPRLLEVKDGATVLARQQISTDATTLRLGPFVVGDGTSALTFAAAPDPQPLGATDPREASVFLASLALTPAPAYVASAAH